MAEHENKFNSRISNYRHIICILGERKITLIKIEITFQDTVDCQSEKTKDI